MGSILVAAHSKLYNLHPRYDHNFDNISVQDSWLSLKNIQKLFIKLMSQKRTITPHEMDNKGPERYLARLVKVTHIASLLPV